MEICGKELRTRGHLIRVGYIDGEGCQFLENPEAALSELRKSKKRIDLFTFIQKLSEPLPKYAYPMEWDNFAVLPITTFDEWMERRLQPRIRRMVRKTVKDGIETREVPLDDDLIRGIRAIYNESPIRQNRRFPHYGDDFETIRRAKATFSDQSFFIGAFYEGKLIGFAKLVTDEAGTQAGFMHIVSMIRHQDIAPTNAVIAQAVRSCAERNICRLWYGNYHYGRRGHDSLAEFKRRNGFEQVLVPRYYIPFTFAGWVALRLGLHHGKLDWVPRPVAVTYREVRRRWYGKKFPWPGTA